MRGSGSAHHGLGVPNALWQMFLLYWTQLVSLAHWVDLENKNPNIEKQM